MISKMLKFQSVMISKMLWFQSCDFQSVLILKDYDFESVITLESDMILDILKWKWYRIDMVFEMEMIFWFWSINYFEMTAVL